MTAQEIVTRIRQRLAEQGISWRTETVDTFKAGNPETAVSGIATTGMATFDVLKRAAKAGRNFVITHEPTFYNHLDQTAAFEQDATYQAKQRFIREQNLVVWRFHDHAHAIRPDPLVAGSARMLGWSSYASPTEPRIYVVPQTTLRQLARDVATRLEGRAIRVAGDPDDESDAHRARSGLRRAGADERASTCRSAARRRSRAGTPSTSRTPRQSVSRRA